MVFREVTYLAVVLRILCAVLIGGVIGIERSVKNRPAGLRTYMLVCVGACLFTLTNAYVVQTTGTGDPMRLGAQVVSGIGFLGAGTIIVTKHNQIKGLTTAAGLWSAAGVGLALGIGFYEGALTAAIAIYAILTLLRVLEDRVNRKTRVLVVYAELKKSVSMGRFINDLRALQVEIEDVQFEQESTVDSGIRALVLTLKSASRRDHIQFLDDIRNIEGLVHVEAL